MTGSLALKTPAKFPNPEKNEYISTPFQIKCGEVTAEAQKMALDLSGPMNQIMKILTSPYRGAGGSFSADPNVIVLAFSGRYAYPSIRQDWSQDRVYLEYNGNYFNLKSEGTYSKIYMKDEIIGVKLDGGDLKPILFEGVINKLDISKAKVIEFFAKGKQVGFGYLKIDFNNSTIHIDNSTPFPDK